MKTRLCALWMTVPAAATGITGCRPAPEGAAAVEYIAHAAFRLTSAGGSSVLVDPFGSRIWIGYDWPDAVTADAIFITHPHYDHDAGVSRGRRFPWDSTVIPVYRSPGTYRVGEITVYGVRGRHADPYGVEFGQINTIWVIDLAGLRIVHWGDNGPLTDGIAADLAAIGPVDIVMLPIDASYHIIDRAAIDRIVEVLDPAWLVPMHYALPTLEPADGPDGLGPIDPWLAGQPGVHRLPDHRIEVTPESVRAAPGIVVFEPSPGIARQ